MQPSIRRHIRVLTLAACASLAGGTIASAQLMPGSMAPAGQPRPEDEAAKARTDKAIQQQPAAVPGARARQPAAPATKSAGDMEPNDALFDAINRGDIASARDALNRGADLNAVNVLGMTPMELSVDLGRNDISFLLLSMRGEGGSSGGSAAARSTRPAASARPGPVAAAKPSPAARPAPAPKVAASKPAPTPKLWANDGGTPQPNAGFLGFGSSRQASN